MNTVIDMSILPPRELAKALLRIDPHRAWIPDTSVPIGEVVKALRCGGGGARGGGPRGYDVSVWGTHIMVARSQGVQHDPPIRFTTLEIVKEMRAEAHAIPVVQLGLWAVEGASA